MSNSSWTTSTSGDSYYNTFNTSVFNNKPDLWRNYAIVTGEGGGLNVRSTLTYYDDKDGFHVKIGEKHLIADRGGENYDLVKKIVMDYYGSNKKQAEILVSVIFNSGLKLPIESDRIKIVKNEILLDGAALDQSWFITLCSEPNLARILLVNIGDEVVIQGDEDAPDGRYHVMGVDNSDSTQRVYLETEDGFLGFIKNSSIKEIYHAPA